MTSIPKALHAWFYLFWLKFCLNHQVYTFNFTCSWNQDRISCFGYILMQNITRCTKVSTKFHCKYDYFFAYKSHRASHSETFNCVVKYLLRISFMNYIFPTAAKFPANIQVAQSVPNTISTYLPDSQKIVQLCYRVLKNNTKYLKWPDIIVFYT